MLKSFQVPVISALISSYVIALFFVPIASLIGKKEKNTVDLKNVDLEEEDEDVSPLVIKMYQFILKNKIIISFIILGGMFALYQNVSGIEEVDIESPRDPFNNINLTFNKEIPEDQRKNIVDDIEALILEKKEELGYQFALTEYIAKDTSGRITLYPFDSDNIDKALDNLKEKMDKLTKSFKLIPGFKMSTGYEDSDSSSGPKKMTVRLQGAKTLKLKNIEEQLIKQMSQVKGVIRINSEAQERGSLSFKFIPKMAVINQYGLTLKKISSQVSSLMNSYNIDGLIVDGKKVQAKVKMSPSGSDWTKEAMKKVRISVGRSNFVPLGDLGTFLETRQVRSITRKKGLSFLKFYVYFNGTLSSKDYRKTKKNIRKILTKYPFPKGYGKKKRDSFAKIEEMKKKGKFVIFMAIFLIYLIMASLFESPLLPFAILFTVPLAIIFGISGLHFLQFDLDPMARLGLIILIGVVVNNAIILIDVILKLRSRGKRRNDAIALGCAQRLKAVLMTTATTVFGLLPVAMGQAKIMGIPYSTLGICIISGMTFSTLITLVLLPLVYILFDSMEFKIKDALGLNR
jgi:HAE1 family hydrophobic/amphiphilic exporter-1